MIRPHSWSHRPAMHRSGPVLPALAALALLLAACGNADPASDEPPDSVPASVAAAPSEEPEASVATEPSAATEDGVTVTLSGFAFSTGELVVPAGTEVTFENADSAAHTVTEGTDGRPASDPIINAQLGAEATTTFAFDEPGEYEITCLFHPSMNMTVVVEG
jgi:plastocyanin